MKSGKFVIDLVAIAITLLVVLYFGVNLITYAMDPYSTTVVYAFTGENAASVSGYVVRNEEVLPGGGELMYSSRTEGERVCAGGTVALVYDSVEAFNNASTLRSLQEQMEQLSYARDLAASTQSSGGLDEEISDAIIAFRADMAAGDFAEAGESGSALRAAVLKRSYAYTGTGTLDQSMLTLQAQIDALSASTATGATQITAPAAGLFSSLADGYESVLTLDTAADLTPSAYRTLTPQATAGNVGKIVYGSKWGFVTLVRSEDLGGLKEGGSVTIRFQKGLDRDMEMTLESVSREEDGYVVALFTSEKYLSLVTLLRQQNAQVIFESFDGLRVPRSAVRVDAQTVTDADGNTVLTESGEPKTENVTGVYCVWGGSVIQARFKPVEVLWQEDEYILVQPMAGASATRILRPGDQVITAAADLYDGKVIE